MLRVLFSLVFLGFTSPLIAGDILAEKVTYYYGAQLEASKQPKLSPIGLKKNEALLASSRGADFKKKIHVILNSFHISRPGDFDEIVEFCHIDENDHCYTQIKLSYREARMHLFGDLHLQGSNSNNYKIESHYCQEWISNDLFPNGIGIGPMKIPSSNFINTEHTWPQSQFSSKFPASLQKSDLHALYPTISRVNSTRGNESFGEVEEVISVPCSKSALGFNKHNDRVFEPAEAVKGNVARAKFYFSARYNISIPAHEEAVLRMWHKLDPVDREEEMRAQEIFEIQHIRNPFIDNPEWVDQIDNF